MHPVIARFLDASRAVAALEAPAASEPEVAAFVAAAQALPQSRDALLAAKGRTLQPTDAQGALVHLSVHATIALLAQDPVLGPLLQQAREALGAEGASSDEAEQLLADAVLEEAFSVASEPDEFDAAFLGQTFEELRALAGLSTELVDDLLERFAREGDAGLRALRTEVAETLLEAAWGEGPHPITTEHVDDALELLADSVATSEFEKAAAQVVAFLQVLGEKKFVGPLRLERLTHVAQSAARAGVESLVDGEEEEDDESGEVPDDEA